MSVYTVAPHLRVYEFALMPSGDREDLGWQDKARCAEVDPELHFPEKGGSTREARRICQGCEVRDLCLDYALEHGEEHGVWGGLSEQERRRLRREQARPGYCAAGRHPVTEGSTYTNGRGAPQCRACCARTSARTAKAVA